MYISTINWPIDKKISQALYIGFILKICKNFDISFPQNLPCAKCVAHRYLKADHDDSEYNNMRNMYHNEMLNTSGFTFPRNKKSALLRLGGLLLSGNIIDGYDDYNEALFFIFQLIEFLGYDTEIARKIMIDHFDFQ